MHRSLVKDSINLESSASGLPSCLLGVRSGSVAKRTSALPALTHTFDLVMRAESFSRSRPLCHATNNTARSRLLLSRSKGHRHARPQSTSSDSSTSETGSESSDADDGDSKKQRKHGQNKSQLAMWQKTVLAVLVIGLVAFAGWWGYTHDWYRRTVDFVTFPGGFRAGVSVLCLGTRASRSGSDLADSDTTFHCRHSRAQKTSGRRGSF